ncbi:Hsp70 family protein [Ameyamaea chiangmaiensis]|uniref:Hsp70 family protein n=1 Tax=Ameyamaea chiangmaiensis TaxID=442969 RepID=A0A850P3G0_9PROT|nr:Hsp70 family protein [Ameyamaea chiangmaiensis]MBS4073799.1 Hsp70 family protein [Ameyamaea chiangmaiensis]NVN39205.1 Hsp70 family protein [Ameyamaea chiangmaiensis]
MTNDHVRLGIDFGTTNSVVVLALPDGRTRALTFRFDGHPDSETCRTLLCLWQEEERGRLAVRDAIGLDAIDAYLDDPTESRLIMSMKTYLAQGSFRETRLLGRTMTLQAIIARFLSTLMRTCDLDPARATVTVGRPVRFAGELADDELGVTRLRESFLQAGFHDIRLALEPEGAGWRFMQRLDRPATILVGDFGGGTSDFSVMRFDPDAPVRARTLGHAGVGIAGDQFDFRIIDAVVSPALGRDTTYRIMGGEPLPVPAEWYAGLSRWHRLSLMRTPQVLRSIHDVAKTASEPDKIRNLAHLIEDQQGQALYRAVGAAKSALSSQEETVLRFSHRGLLIEQTVTRHAFEQWIAPDLVRLDDAVSDVLDRAGLGPDAIDRVFLTGGTSFVPAVRGLFDRRFGAHKVDTGSEFVSVGEGLALMEHAATVSA